MFFVGNEINLISTDYNKKKIVYAIKNKTHFSINIQVLNHTYFSL